MGIKHHHVLGLALSALAAVGCGPTVGDECQPNEGACVDGTTELVCQGGVFIASPCRGPAGCVQQGANVTCDISANRTGDACSTDDVDRGACSQDSQTMVVCRNGAYKLMPCRGATHCQQRGPQNAVCDVSVAVPGDECEGEEAACSTDGQSMLSCQNGRMAQASPCRGANHCQVQGTRISCDTSVGAVGDTCSADYGAACSADGLSMLHCVDGHVAVMNPCRGPDGCKVNGRMVSCDESLAAVGDACEGSNAACRVDGLALLECSGGTFTQTRECASCVVQGSRVMCN